MHGKDPLPCKYLPCGLGFAMCFLSWQTLNFPIVHFPRLIWAGSSNVHLASSELFTSLLIWPWSPVFCEEIASVALKAFSWKSNIENEADVDVHARSYDERRHVAVLVNNRNMKEHPLSNEMSTSNNHACKCLYPDATLSRSRINQATIAWKMIALIVNSVQWLN